MRWYKDMEETRMKEAVVPRRSGFAFQRLHDRFEATKKLAILLFGAAENLIINGETHSIELLAGCADAPKLFLAIR